MAETNIEMEMQERIFKAENYNWQIMDYFSGFIGKRVVEVGCGLGQMTKILLRKAELVCCVDISSAFISFLEKRFSKRKNFCSLEADAASKKILSLKNKGFDTVVCLNVLEHIKDDGAALQNFSKILPKGGRLLILVPAFDFLFGSLDAGHFRRYSKKLLKKRLEENGFKILAMRFQNFFGAFGWFVNGRILKRKIIPEKQLLFFDRLVPLLFRLEKLIGPPFGQSLLCVAEKL